MYRVIELRKTCNACPSQWEGMLDDGRNVYVRFRWGYLEITIHTGNLLEGITIFGKTIGDNLAGVMSFSKLVEITSKVIEFDCEERIKS